MQTPYRRNRLLGLLLLACLLAGTGRATPAEEAAAAKRSGDYSRAIALYEQLLLQEPANPTWYLQLGTVQGWSGRHREAVTTLERGLAIAPGNFDLRVAQARALAWAGALGRAEALAGQLAAEQPHDRDVLNLLGRVLLWQRRYDAAEEVFHRILALAPDDTDALVGAGDVQRFQERLDVARPFYEHALRTDPQSREIARRLEAVRGTGRWRLDVGGDASTFTGNSGRSDWQGADLALRYAADKRTGLSAAAAWAHRYDLTDLQFSLGADRRLADDLAGYVRLSATPAADFLARHMEEAGGEWGIRPGGAGRLATTLLADYRAATYGPGTAHSLWLGVRQATGRRIDVTAKALVSRNLNAHWTRGWLMRLDGDPSDLWHWNLGYADSRESLSSTVYDFTRELRHRAVFGGVIRELSPGLGVRLDLTHEWSPGQAARNALHAGIVTHF